MNTADVKEFVSLEKEKRDLSARLKTVQARLNELDGSIQGEFLTDGIQSINIDGRTVYLHRDVYASPKDSNRAAVVEALEASGLGQYVKRDYNAQSLTAYVREQLAAAEEYAAAEERVITEPAEALPPALAAVLNVSTVFSVSSRKA